MTKILYGNEVALKIKEDLKLRIEKLKEKYIVPKLAIVRMGNKQDDISYEKSIIKNCEKLNIETQVYELKEDILENNFLKLMERLNAEDNIHGILVFRPYPKHLNESLINSSISLNKDVDCMHPLNLEKIFEGHLDGFMPCTPEAVMEILKYYDIDLKGKNIAIINRSMVVGKPLSMMALSNDATVTICHSKTMDLPSITKKADIVVTAIGKAKLIKEEYFNEDSIVIDVSINVDENGKLCGDVDFENVKEKVAAITPVPKGVGSVTTTLLLKHIVEAAERDN
ncbi:bifunctional 5,10-methylenetetrahydrofolate dehydrogenase/5,10-methenyltetrahydrofolate cyclohydrolase [Clostridium tepidum]|jgi:methylenetetrahydrofolate dehydrogenase (NADP+)/methenyltetrahydrofolate cyclohydrolase|uniref:Bifunctional protein FolD n=1 Tax=Clostridium tepidum TaxID=1962263 RepID=A0A1S9IBR7_9CLOT|nr:bifunctional 5,10-methylenetetrahydrofolate dehydrogenase/5,10-methenyltetrahydrofolate cyclohydrolase [Clostridium tepidum]MCR1933427.1 bifunctional 5,10-methylenetetrahydrofolate dehydrogenase/5,10-methenyltetrahydrofolate cyclohydrolase [Clostridium tepidum]MDU6878176.1 bifunctional 5,10-methylenetetrahydrofolate dehydrogenase/5,10-methenyltetrahydrofolate cyclohydrolase [Clostridium botulinum]OOO61696.1 bifunctional 5,10-methylene-tetrahydrofolate dehydrogenase/5,10-methylene-tetrahydrofo